MLSKTADQIATADVVKDVTTALRHAGYGIAGVKDRAVLVFVGHREFMVGVQEVSKRPHR